MALYGRQAIVELHGCDAALLDNVSALQEIMVRAAQASGAHIVDVVAHKFSPQGASVVVVISESHMSIHTWPELQFAAVDIFSCSSALDLAVAWGEISRGVGAREATCKVLPRLHEEGSSSTDEGEALHLVITKDNTVLKVTESLHKAQTRWQSLELVRTMHHGACLLLDQVPQSAEGDEFIYHEALVHPGLLAHPAPRRVLIVGGGEGATAREVLRHPTVERVVMVELDEEVVNFCRANMPQWHQGAFDDARLELVIDDGRKYLERARERFDCLVVDLTDVFPLTPASRLYTREFYQLARARLGDQGTLAAHTHGMAPAHLDHAMRIISTLRDVFPLTVPYRTFVPVLGQEWGFALAGPAEIRALTPEAVDRKLAERGIRDLRFYDGATHLTMTTMPRHIRKALEKSVPVLTDVEIDASTSQLTPLALGAS